MKIPLDSLCSWFLEPKLCPSPDPPSLDTNGHRSSGIGFSESTFELRVSPLQGAFRRSGSDCSVALPRSRGFERQSGGGRAGLSGLMDSKEPICFGGSALRFPGCSVDRNFLEPFEEPPERTLSYRHADGIWRACEVSMRGIQFGGLFSPGILLLVWFLRVPYHRMCCAYSVACVM